MHGVMFSTLSIALLLIGFVPLAAAEESFSCHDWEIFIGDRYGTGVGASPDDGAIYAGTMDVPGGLYVVSDGDPVRNGFLFSIWVYQENNGVPGLQRGDEMCDETDDGQIEQDCLISCTF